MWFDIVHIAESVALSPPHFVSAPSAEVTRIRYKFCESVTTARIPNSRGINHRLLYRKGYMKSINGRLEIFSTKMRHVGAGIQDGAQVGKI